MRIGVRVAKSQQPPIGMGFPSPPGHTPRVGRVYVYPPPVPNRDPWPFVGCCYVGGLQILIENLPGSVRKWPGGSTKMKAIYGEILNTIGSDGDPIDCYVGPDPEAPKAWVIHQRIVSGEAEGSYDEDKVMLGFADRDAAMACYRDHYSDPERFIGGVTEWNMGDLMNRVLGDEYRDGGVPLVKSEGEHPPAGYQAIPGGSHGGYRKKRQGGYDYWYPGHVAHDAHPKWEPDPTRTSADAKPGEMVQVGGRQGNYRWTPDHAAAPELMTWVTSLSTGEHELVRQATVHPLRPHVARAVVQRKPPPLPPPRRNPPGPTGEGPKPPRVLGPQTDIPSGDAKRIKTFPGSQAAPGTVLHDLEHGGFQVAKFKSGTGGEGERYRTGTHVPKARHAEMLREFQPLISGAARRVANRYGIRVKDQAGPTAAYEELLAGSHVGFVMALSSYQGGSPFVTHAQRYAVTYATAQARTELGAGVPIPDRTMRMLGGFMASTHRASIRFGTDRPTPAQVAQVWVVKKRDVYTGTLEGDQGEEPVPDGDWRIKGPKGEIGKPLPGKVQLAGQLQQLTQGDKVEDQDWMIRHEDPQLPDRLHRVLPVGAALQMRQELDEILDELPEQSRRALEMDAGLHVPDGEPATALEIADALQISVGSEDQSRRRAVKKLIDQAVASATRVAEKRRSGAAAWFARWQSKGDDRPEFTPKGPATSDLLKLFGGDEERVRVYSANARAGHGSEALRVLQHETHGGASADEVRAVRERAGRQRDVERLAAFRRHSATRVVEADNVKDAQVGTPGEADHLYGQVVETGYMVALAKRGRGSV